MMRLVKLKAKRAGEARVLPPRLLAPRLLLDVEGHAVHVLG